VRGMFERKDMDKNPGSNEQFQERFRVCLQYRYPAFSHKRQQKDLSITGFMVRK
jgi:hypothetical protein